MDELIVNERKFRGKIVDIINNSNLPAFVLKAVIKELLEEIIILEEKQYQKAVEIQKQKEEKSDG